LEPKVRGGHTCATWSHQVPPRGARARRVHPGGPGEDGPCSLGRPEDSEAVRYRERRILDKTPARTSKPPSLYFANFMPDLRFLDGFGTGSTGANQKTCLKLNRKCRTRDIPQWHFSPAVFLASKTTQIKNRVKIRVKWGHTVS